MAQQTGKTRNKLLSRRILPVVLAAIALGGLGFSALLPAQSGTRTTPDQWLAPNIDSPDFVSLFTTPDAWSQTRRDIDVMQFYVQNVTAGAPCAACGHNSLDAFQNADAFRKLTSWGVKIAIEGPAVKSWGCGRSEGNVVKAAIRNIVQSGGKVRYLSMDEPVIGAHGPNCNLDRDASAKSVASYARDIHASYPEVAIGDIVPYPRLSPAQIGEWLDSLQKAGFKPAFVHLDIDRQAVKARSADMTGDLKTIRHDLARRGIPFGVILWANVGSDQGYHDEVMSLARDVVAGSGVPSDLVYQNWSAGDGKARGVPHNLPSRSSSSSMMQTIEGVNKMIASY